MIFFNLYSIFNYIFMIYVLFVKWIKLFFQYIFALNVTTEQLVRKINHLMQQNLSNETFEKVTLHNKLKSVEKSDLYNIFIMFYFH